MSSMESQSASSFDYNKYEASRKNLSELKEKLGKLSKTTISDGRVFVGTFICADSQCNIILAHATEYREASCRKVGSVMVPGAHIVKSEVEAAPLYT
ncbi:hypothetical protein DSO57_1000053 [Entomophthora muscae]|uniref:Uncharacterized protein n=1 Tax=Entomophthora muscae TaxID=34485 RepID=A0ACC2SMG2_9FUNG|nr:hypothetical protein DSO57_1000053 [Entomophthora muscae]